MELNIQTLTNSEILTRHTFNTSELLYIVFCVYLIVNFVFNIQLGLCVLMFRIKFVKLTNDEHCQMIGLSYSQNAKIRKFYFLHDLKPIPVNRSPLVLS